MPKINTPKKNTFAPKTYNTEKIDSMGNLAGQIAHDCNNYLTAIMGFMDLADLRIDPEHPAKGCMGEIKHACDKTAIFTSKLLAIGKNRAFSPKKTNINKIISNTDKIVRENIDVELRVQSNIHDIMADPMHVQELLKYLLNNAKEAIPRKGKIIIETKNVNIDKKMAQEYPELNCGPYVLLSISDNGIGMSQEVMSRAFEPFFTTKTAVKGIGLSLTATYRIVKQCNGLILVESQPKLGTTFKIYFPKKARKK
ncbi:hypothetical protein JYT19_00345 [Sulfobacillus acidophilus]|uniref:histidine kinase n=1 Tax=Sulfobacillus acidophilus TaxID=53633 RepID=A0ABS3AVE9_9FIRM|nr:hypothetical protein [Sulfobacillus acidophilus]